MCCAYDYLTDLNKCILAQFANLYGTHSEASVRKCRGKLFQDDGILSNLYSLQQHHRGSLTWQSEEEHLKMAWKRFLSCLQQNSSYVLSRVRRCKQWMPRWNTLLSGSYFKLLAKFSWELLAGVQTGGCLSYRRWLRSLWRSPPWEEAVCRLS